MGLTHAGRPDSPHYAIPETGTHCSLNPSRDPLQPLIRAWWVGVIPNLTLTKGSGRVKVWVSYPNPGLYPQSAHAFQEQERQLKTNL